VSLTPADVMDIERARWDREIFDNPDLTTKDVARLVGCGRRGAGYIMRAVKRLDLGDAPYNHRASKVDVEDWLLEAAGALPIALTVGCGVYFMGCGDAVKIGVTIDLEQRLDSIRACNPSPIEALLLFPGNAAQEWYYHGRFREHLIHGEWFRREGTLDNFLRSHHR
jgi:hypothetical protein